MPLREYRTKRSFDHTAEPRGGEKNRARTGARRFVVQKHEASRLHYDFRLEIGGTLKSWAVPKGIPFAKGEKRLAVQVEDHPVSYRDFEGPIPKGQYGGGTVMVWDRGTFEPLSETPAKDLAAGKLHVVLTGRKLKGEWYLVRLRKDEKQWLLIRGGSDMRPVSKKQDDTSALSGKSMEALAGTSRDSETHPKVVSASRAASRAKSKPAPSAPVPGFVEPMKALLVTSPPSSEGWQYEIKFDGYRALALKGSHGVRLVSRNENDLSGKFPGIVEALEELEVGDAIIDGEIVALDEKSHSSFQLLQSFVLGRKRPPLFFYVFDLLRLNGKDLKSLPLTDRKAQLAKLVDSSKGIIRFSPALDGEVKRILKEVQRLGLEGIIGKQKDSVYETGRRSGAWIKLKLHREQEFVIGGYTEPEGSRKHFGAILVGVYEGKTFKYAGKVGTGFDATRLRSLHAQFKRISTMQCPFKELPEQRRGRYGQGITSSEMKRCHWVRPELVCQVKFAEWTRDNRLRQPVFLGLREDKNPKEVVREIPA